MRPQFFMSAKYALVTTQRISGCYFKPTIKVKLVFNLQWWVSPCLDAKLNMMPERAPPRIRVIKLPVNGAIFTRGLFGLRGWDKLPSGEKFLSRAPGNTNLLITHDLPAKRELCSSMGPPIVFPPFLQHHYRKHTACLHASQCLQTP